MPHAEHLGQRIHYTDEGSGPLVVLQHGFLSKAASWKDSGFVDVLTDRYRVVCVDSLAHGDSDAPVDPARYALQPRAGDLVAVLDAVGEERMHLLGYSMGGWMAGGVATHHRDRLASLTIAGWDCVHGYTLVTDALGVELTAELLLATARAQIPELVAWVTPEREPAVLVCGNALVTGPLDASAAVEALPVPVMCWNGNADPYHQTMQPWAATHGYPYVETEGDHLAAMALHGAAAARGYGNLLDRLPR